MLVGVICWIGFPAWDWITLSHSMVAEICPPIVLVQSIVPVSPGWI